MVAVTVATMPEIAAQPDEPSVDSSIWTTSEVTLAVVGTFASIIAPVENSQSSSAMEAPCVDAARICGVMAWADKT